MLLHPRSALVCLLTGALALPGQAAVLPRDTPVHLMVLTEVSTKKARPGDRFRLLVREPVLIDGRVAISVNAAAIGEVVSATESGALGKSGKLAARLVHVEGPAGPIPLTGTTEENGPGGATQTVLGVVGLGVVGLFARGTNAKLKAGDQLTGYVAADTQLP
jgi:hypothetical protein